MELKLGAYYLLETEGNLVVAACVKEPKTDKLLVDEVECVNDRFYSLERGIDLDKWLKSEENFKVLAAFDAYEECRSSQAYRDAEAKAKEKIQIENLRDDFSPDEASSYGWRGIDGGEGMVETFVAFDLTYKDNAIASYEGCYEMLPYKEQWDFSQSEFDMSSFGFKPIDDALKREIGERCLREGEDFEDGVSRIGYRLLRGAFVFRCDADGVGYWD